MEHLLAYGQGDEEGGEGGAYLLCNGAATCLLALLGMFIYQLSFPNLSSSFKIATLLHLSLSRIHSISIHHSFSLHSILPITHHQAAYHTARVHIFAIPRSHAHLTNRSLLMFELFLGYCRPRQGFSKLPH